MLIDSHAHLEMKEFDADRAAVIERARLAGVSAIITVGTNLSLSLKALSIARQYPHIYATIGVHPHDVAGADAQTFDELTALASSDPKVVAYGEIGLDYFRNLSPREIQLAQFARQLDMAASLNLPVVIHDRDAHEETLRMVRASKVRRGVFHCFSGDWAMARQCIDLGFYLSVPGVVTFDKSQKLQEVVRQAPLDALLLETDAPYLTPAPHRGKRNEPSFIVHTAQCVARIRGMEWEELSQAAAVNTCRLFGINLPSEMQAG